MWERDHLKRKAIITKDESDWVNFKTKKTLVNYKIRNSKQQYYNSYAFQIMLVVPRKLGKVSTECQSFCNS
jgi:hypothetical protein